MFAALLFFATVAPEYQPTGRYATPVQPTGRYAPAPMVYAPTGKYAVEVNTEPNVAPLPPAVEFKKPTKLHEDPPFVEYLSPPLPPEPEPPKKAVKKPISPERFMTYAPWYQQDIAGNLKPTTNEHLVEVHGEDPNFVATLTQDKKDHLHGYYHKTHTRGPWVVQAGTTPPKANSAPPVPVQPAYRPVQTSGCPGGQCPTSNYRYSRRRR